MRTILIVLGLVVLIVLGAWYFFMKKEMASPTAQNVTGEETPTAPFTFSYPEDFGLTYVTPVDWPPVLTPLTNETMACTPGGEEGERAGKTEEVTIGEKVMCRTIVSEGAAGSVYKQYAYIFDHEGVLLSLTFSVRMPQCLNYDQPEQDACVIDQQEFTPDLIVADMVDTLR